MISQEKQQQLDKLNRQQLKINLKQKIVQRKINKNNTSQLIKLGELIAQAKLDHLNHHTIYGALLSIAENLNNTSVLQQFEQMGKQKLDQQNINQTKIILNFEQIPQENIKTQIRQLGLQYNPYFKKWTGNINLNNLQTILQNCKYNVEQLTN